MKQLMKELIQIAAAERAEKYEIGQTLYYLPEDNTRPYFCKITDIVDVDGVTHMVLDKYDFQTVIWEFKGLIKHVRPTGSPTATQTVPLDSLGYTPYDGTPIKFLDTKIISDSNPQKDWIVNSMRLQVALNPDKVFDEEFTTILD